MNRLPAALLALGLLTASPAFSQATVCIPREAAARNADSLRTLPLVRLMLSGSRQEARAVTQQLSASQARATDLNTALLEQTRQAVLWKSKARRRGLIIGLAVGIPAVYGVYQLLK